MSSVRKNMQSFLKSIAQRGSVSISRRNNDNSGSTEQPTGGIITFKKDNSSNWLCGYLSDEELVKIMEKKNLAVKKGENKTILELFNAEKVNESMFDLDKDGDIDSNDFKSFVKNCSAITSIDNELETILEKISKIFTDKIQEGVKNQFEIFDANKDGVIKFDDTLIVAQKIAKKDKNYDLNNDGIVNNKDLQVIFNNKCMGLTLSEYSSQELSVAETQAEKLRKIIQSAQAFEEDEIVIISTDDTPTVIDDGVRINKPVVSDGKVTFLNNTQLKISSGETAIVNANNNVSISNTKGNNLKVYNAYGTLVSTINGLTLIGHYNANENCLEFGKNTFSATASSNVNKIQLKSGDVVKENSDGSFTITNGSKKVTYSSNGVMLSGATSEYYTYMSKLKSIGLSGKYNLSLPSNFSQATSNCDLSEAVKADIDMLVAADSYAKTQSNYTTAFNNYIENAMVKNYKSTAKSNKEIFAETNVGDVIEKSDGLYVNDGSGLIKLNMTKAQYLELFPPVTRYSTEQNDIGDCYFISGVLLGCLENPVTYAKLLQMISIDKNNNVTIRFDGMYNYPVTFKNGNLYNADGLVNGRDSNCGTTQVTGAKGVKLLEQAFAIARFAQESTRTVNGVDIDAAYSYIEGGNNDEAQNCIFGSGFARKKLLKNLSTSQKTKLLESYADALNSGEIVLGAGTYSYSSDKNYYVVGSHAYSVESIDTVNQTVTFINPWTGGVAITIPYTKFFSYFDVLYVADLNNI